jgi:hypothetical protein
VDAATEFAVARRASAAAPAASRSECDAQTVGVVASDSLAHATTANRIAPLGADATFMVVWSVA